MTGIGGGGGTNCGQPTDGDDGKRQGTFCGESATSATVTSAHPAPLRSTTVVIVGIEARGFIFGLAIALAIGAKFIPLRKPRKLPGF
ncbi:hypothetical protein BDA96_07G075700 [Sorghum bicolor]|uniref:adenine phosphoribosyltransferase n=1 Tax=Sorghum bicolor TaxID=4558 RepID=A0A921QLG2_SORBI|nr:hypothetical protein BDA96_07G075700 [Sorghum bicolor]